MVHLLYLQTPTPLLPVNPTLASAMLLTWGCPSYQRPPLRCGHNFLGKWLCCIKTCKKSNQMVLDKRSTDLGPLLDCLSLWHNYLAFYWHVLLIYFRNVRQVNIANLSKQMFFWDTSTLYWMLTIWHCQNFMMVLQKHKAFGKFVKETVAF